MSANATNSDTEEAPKDRVFIESVARAFRVLEAFSDRPEPQSLSQLAAAAGIDKSAAQRLAHTLTRLGYLEQRGGGLTPGRKSLDRAFDYLRSEPLVRRAVPILSDLRRDVRERVDFSLYEGVTMLYAARLQSKRDTFYGHLIGRRVPTFCTAGGRAALARLPTAEAREILDRSERIRHTPRTTTDVDALMTRLEETRDAGYAVACDQLHMGEVGVGAAVIDRDGRPLGAVHIAGTLGEWDAAEFSGRFGPLAVAAATAITPD